MNGFYALLVSRNVFIFLEKQAQKKQSPHERVEFFMESQPKPFVTNVSFYFIRSFENGFDKVPATIVKKRIN